MFGLIVSGRPVDAAPQGITPTQFAFRVASNPPFSHIVVFVLPGTALPQGTAGSVYIQIPPSQDFKLLGALGPGKESAIFKVSGMKSGAHGDVNVDIDVDAMTEDPIAPSANANSLSTGDIVVGVSIEPAEQVQAQIALLKQAQGAASNTSTAVVLAGDASRGRIPPKQLAKNIIGNAFDFLASFGSDQVPLKAFQDWWAKFEKKVDLDPSFLEKARDG